MPLADDFQAVVDSLPPDWTQLELDLRIDDEDRYVEAATLLTQINAMPYSEHDWHWRLRSAHEFGHAAAPETVHGTLALLDEQGIAGELVLREARAGRVEVDPDVGPARVGARGVPPAPRAVARWLASRCTRPTCCSARRSRAPCAPPGHEVVRGGGRARSRWSTSPRARCPTPPGGVPDRRLLPPHRPGHAPAGRGGGLRPGRAALADGARGGARWSRGCCALERWRS